MTLASSVFSSTASWYLIRSTGVVSFVLFTLTFALGLAATKRALASPGWPRFATQHLHRNVSLLALVFLVVHVIATMLDSYVTVGWWAVVIPGASNYEAFGMTFGTVASDLALVIIATSLLRDRIPLRWWRWVHWTAYAMWPFSFIHFWQNGTDAAHGRWGIWLDVVCLLVLAAAAAVRWLTPDEPSGPIRSLHGATSTTGRRATR